METNREDILNISESCVGKYYHYEHSAYDGNLQPINPPLDVLAPDFDNTDGKVNNSYTTIRWQVEELSHEEQVKALNNLIMHYLVRWHDKKEDIWRYPMQVAVALMDALKLHECLPTLLEILRQDLEFYKMFFKDLDIDKMIPATLFQIMEKEDLPVLLDFMKTPGMLFYAKQNIAMAVAHLPVKGESALPLVQEWLTELVKFYAPMGKETDMFNEALLETLVYGCIHTHAVNAKDVIVRLYNQYKMPNALVKGGCNEVRKTIKKAPLGTLEGAGRHGEYVFIQYLNRAENVECFGEEDDEEYAEGFDWDEFDWNEYRPWAQCGKAEYLPVTKDLKMFKIKVVLRGTDPEIWREFEAPSNLKLTSFAGMILCGMGWDEDHLHQFVKVDGKKPTFYATSYNELSGHLDARSKDGRKFSIGDLLQKQGDNAFFEYDYGDSWNHVLTLMEVVDCDGNAKVALIGGERACPPEDCGGIAGYMHICEVMKDLDSIDAQDLAECIGCKFDPERFPLNKAKKVIDSFN